MPLAALGAGEIVLIVIAALFVVALVVLALNYKKVGPNQVLIVSGGFRKKVKEPDGTVRTVGYKMRIGGGAFVLPLFQTADVLHLEMQTVQVKADDALTKGGVTINAAGLAQVKVGSSEAAIRRAAEQFLGRGADAIRDAAHPVLEGLLRAFLGSATVEEIYQNRDEFNSRLSGEVADEFEVPFLGEIPLDMAILHERWLCRAIL